MEASKAMKMGIGEVVKMGGAMKVGAGDVVEAGDRYNNV